MENIGKYVIFLYSTLVNRETLRTGIQRTVEECVAIGIDSVPIVALVSIFTGGVTSIQIYYNLLTALPSDFLVGFSLRNMAILELCPTVMAIIFAGRVGSNIAGQLGSMRITEQIDALEIMGINTSSYLVLPKIIAAMLMYPLLVIISIFLTIYAGFVAAQWVVSVSPDDYIHGLRLSFDPYTVRFALYKAVTFAFLVSSISAYKGFYVTGGAVEVGSAGTRAVTDSCIAILVADYVLTQLLLQSPGGGA